MRVAPSCYGGRAFHRFDNPSHSRDRLLQIRQGRAIRKTKDSWPTAPVAAQAMGTRRRLFRRADIADIIAP